MYKSFGKRWIGFVLALILTILISPLLLGLAIAIKCESKGPVFFRQKRVGLGRSHFEIYKFRSMRTDTPKDMPTHLLQNPEAFITKVGGFLRKTSLDELPQLFNILKGEMAWVGPRPALWNQYDLLEERDKYGANDVVPGLTGWAQINGRDELEIPVKARLDGEYVKRLSFLFDCRCFLGTFLSVLRQEGVVEGGTGAMSPQAAERTARCIILVPIYKEIPSENESYAIASMQQKLGAYPLACICPDGLKTAYYREKFGITEFHYFENWKADSLSDYNELLMTTAFYEKYKSYEFMLLFQPDALILGEKEQLEGFLNSPFDYWGAPWEGEGYCYRKRTIRGAGHSGLLRALQGETCCKVGNGGVSLRRVEAMIRLFSAYTKEEREKEQAGDFSAEDIVISFFGQKEKAKLRFPSAEAAGRFALETDMQERIAQGGERPFAVHKWERYFPTLLAVLHNGALEARGVEACSDDARENTGE